MSSASKVKAAKAAAFQWRQDARTRGIVADDAAAEFERIRAQRGNLSASAIVDESRPKNAVLHPVFVWNDKEAAEYYRRMQARSLIRALVRVETPTEPEHREYVMIREPVSDDGSKDLDNLTPKPVRAKYLPMTEVVTRGDHLSSALAALQRKLNEASASLAEVTNLAAGSGTDKLAYIGLAAKALESASNAIKAAVNA